jgi:quercetin dioxygenase-like cupin family protein
MQRSSLHWGLCVIAIAVTVSMLTLPASATDPVGFTSTTLGTGPFPSLDVSSFFLPQKGQPWLMLLKTKGKSDGYVLSNSWDPGGTTGWHTHSGPTLIIVTAGTITHYDGDDPTCTPKVYTAGMTFVDQGGTHVHIVRNEGDIPAQAYAFRLVPSGQPGRIDAPDPGNCPF